MMRLTIEWGVVFGAAALITWAGNFLVAALIVLVATNLSVGWIKWVERNWPDTSV